MQYLKLLTILSTTLAATLSFGSFAQGQPVQTPLASPITVSGSSTASQAGQCGFTGSAPSQVVVVNQPTPLSFRVKSQGQPTLLIAGPVNRCVMADTQANGEINVPGVWEQGTYSLFVGNVNQGNYPYTLSITPEN